MRKVLGLALAAVIATTTACGGESDPRYDVVTCGAGWDAEYGQINFNGTCARACQSFPAQTSSATCRIAATVNGQPGTIECNDLGHAVEDGGDVGCCLITPTDPDDAEAPWFVDWRSCE